MHGIFYGGATRSLFLLLKSMRTEPFEFIIYSIGCNSDDVKTELLKYVLDFKIVKLKTISVNQVYKESFLKYVINSRISCKKFVDQLKEDNIQILHINSTVFPQLPEWIKKKSNIKVIVHLREWLSEGSDGIIQRFMVRKIKDYSDALIAISSNEANLFKSHNNIIVIPNPFDFTNISKVENNFRETQNINNDTLLIGMFSHFSAAKGHLTFIRSINLIMEKTKCTHNLKFLIVGFRDKRTWLKLLVKKLILKPDYTNTILKTINKLHLNGKIILIPYTNDVFSILKAVDIVIRPADSADPWGRDIIEAMAFGKPVIATGYSDFFIKNNITGFLIPPKDPETLAEHIERMILDKNLREKIGSAAHNFIRKKCDILEYSKLIKEIYLSLIKS